MVERPETDLDWSGLEILSFDDCWDRLRSAPVARIGFVDQGSPVILPVNIVIDGHGIAFRSAAGSKLAAAVMERPVCVQIDQWDAMGHTGWSVLAKGVAEHVLDETATAHLDSLPLLPWTRPDVRVEWIRTLVHEVSGRRITRPWMGE